MDNNILDSPEKRIYPGKLAGQDYKIKLAEEKIEWAQKIMLILAFFAFVKLCLIIFQNEFSYAWFSILIQVIVIIVYLTASYFVKMIPSLCIGLVILFYIAIQALLSYYHGPDYWHEGITFKLALFSFLLFGFFYSIKVKYMRKKLEEDYQKYIMDSIKD